MTEIKENQEDNADFELPEDFLRDTKIQCVTDTEMIQFYQNKTQPEIVLDIKYIEKEIERLRYYIKIIEWDLYQRALKILKEELIKHESQGGINDWLIK